jgi:hypothetical protein
MFLGRSCTMLTVHGAMDLKAMEKAMQVISHTQSPEILPQECISSALLLRGIRQPTMT